MKTAVKNGGAMTEEYGLFLRTGYTIFDQVSSKSGIKFCMIGSMVEIHLFQMVDILAGKNKSNCMIGEDNNLYGAEYKLLDSQKSICEFAAFVENRITGSTLMNDTSSRSHCVAQILLC